MITERMTFQAKYGQGDDLVQLMKQSMTEMPMGETAGARLYTDMTGKMFTVVMEIDYADLAAYARSSEEGMEQYNQASFQDWFGKMVAITEGGERQLFNSEKLA